MRSRIPFIAVFAVTLATASAAQANVYTVATTADTVDSTSDSVCDAPCTLRGAIQTAQAHIGDDTIVLPTGHYVLGPDTDIAPSLDILADDGNSALTVVGAGATQTVIDANSSEAGAPNDDRAMTVEASATVTLRNLEVTGGVADASNNYYGGDITSFGTLSLDHVWLTGGSGESAGAIANRGGTLTIADSLISGNAAGDRGGGGDGGAILNFGQEGVGPAHLTITNTTITANQALLAGAITSYSDPGNTVVLDHDTIAHNQAEPLDGSDGRGTGGLLVGDGTMTLRGSIVYDNTATFFDPMTVAPQNCGIGGGPTASFVSGGGNVGGTTECNLTLASDRPNANPLLGALADNGGQTPTLALLAGSPALDLGGATPCPAVDQRDHARPQGAACDAGAYELDVAPPAGSTDTTPPPPPPPPSEPVPSTVVTGSILYDPAFAPGPPPTAVSPQQAPGHPNGADVLLLGADGRIAAQQHVAFASAALKLSGASGKSPVSQLAGTSPSFELDHVAPCDRCTLELRTGHTVQDSAPVTVTADDPEIDANLVFGQIPDGAFAEGAIVAPKGTNTHNLVVQIFGADTKTPMADTGKLPVTCAAKGAGTGACASAPLTTSGAIRWRLGGLKAKQSAITVKLLQRSAKSGKLIAVDTVHTHLAPAPADTQVPSLTTIDIDPSGPAGRVLEGIVSYHPPFAPGSPDTAGEDLRSVPKAPAATVELHGPDGRLIVKTTGRVASVKDTGAAKGAAAGPTTYRLTNLKPCPGCTLALTDGRAVQDSVAVDVTGDDPSIERQDVEWGRLPGGTYVDGAVNLPRGVAPASVSVQVLRDGKTVVADSAKLGGPCTGAKGSGAGATAHCASSSAGGLLPYRLGAIPPNLKGLTLQLMLRPHSGAPFAVDSQSLDSGDPGSAAEASSMTVPDPAPGGPAGRVVTGAVTTDAPFAPGAPPDLSGVATTGLTVELRAADGFGPAVRVASVPVTSTRVSSTGAATRSGGTLVQSYALSHLSPCLAGCVVVLLHGKTIQDSAPVIVSDATPTVNVAALANNRAVSAAHLDGTLSFASSRTPDGLTVRITSGKTTLADSSKLRGCGKEVSCAKGTHFAFRLAGLPAAGGKATLELRGPSATAKGSGGPPKPLVTRSITLAGDGSDTELGTIKIP